ncbi:hypothetical protein B0T25DRAFT_296659 [Lasiosphaeria hispida]|uniref:Family c-likeg-protein-coupled receptor protein n=1 Tax=Lasiosphaeria hispida TaxID=260671 RepID=A0AAJ0MBE6_9PEZI|nr:hypothetical protein B0T25DRAFT_296659 [Lasiosphaeria hispida]
MSASPAAGGQVPPTTGPPYLPQTAQLGGQPAPLPDVAVSAVLLALFVGSAALHMTVFQVNLHRGHKFIFSVLLFGFSMARITALAMRIAWAYHLSNASVAIAANVFTAAGVMLLFLVNLMFAQRVLRAYLPGVGWEMGWRWVFRGLYFSVVGVLVMVVTSSVHTMFTVDLEARARERDVLLFAGVYLAVLAFLPIVVVVVVRAVVFFLGRRAVVTNEEGEKGEQGRKRVVTDKFGSGRFRTKLVLLLSTSALLTLGAGFRAATNFLPRPITDPAWYHSKPAYYCFNFVIELIVVYAYGLARFDRRFHVPNGSSRPGDYAKGGLKINEEDEVFGPSAADDGASKTAADDDAAGGADWEERYAYSRRMSETLEPVKKNAGGEV